MKRVAGERARAHVLPPAHYVSRLSQDSLLILLFHGVVNENSCPVRNANRKHIERDHFVAILQALCREGTAISMDEVLECCEARRAFRPRSFAITFDDGFENNLSVAAPVLDALRLPATFYLCTRFIDENYIGWIDRIERTIEEVPKGEINFDWLEAPLRFSSVEEKLTAVQTLRAAVKQSPHLDPEAVATSVAEQCGVREIYSSDDPLDRKLTWSDVQALSRLPGVAIGGHSHGHRALAFLSDCDLSEDLEQSITLLREKGGVSSAHYAYPEGQAEHYDARVIMRLRQLGIRCCPSAIDGVNYEGAEPFHLRRVMVV